MYTLIRGSSALVTMGCSSSRSSPSASSRGGVVVVVVMADLLGWVAVALGRVGERGEGLLIS